TGRAKSVVAPVLWLPPTAGPVRRPVASRPIAARSRRTLRHGGVMNETPVTIQFALVSHTNNGKTTLARTLTGVDLGEVRDAAHVTAFSEAHVLQTSAAGDTLLLWDTPGFGDSVRLLKRLAMTGNPIGWFLREV